MTAPSAQAASQPSSAANPTRPRFMPLPNLPLICARVSNSPPFACSKSTKRTRRRLKYS